MGLYIPEHSKPIARMTREELAEAYDLVDDRELCDTCQRPADKLESGQCEACIVDALDAAELAGSVAA